MRRRVHFHDGHPFLIYMKIPIFSYKNWLNLLHPLNLDSRSPDHFLELIICHNFWTVTCFYVISDLTVLDSSSIIVLRFWDPIEIWSSIYSDLPSIDVTALIRYLSFLFHSKSGPYLRFKAFNQHLESTWMVELKDFSPNPRETSI